MTRSRRDTVVWICLLLSLVAGVVRLRSAEAQTSVAIVADGPWKGLPWQEKPRFQPVQVSQGPLLFIRGEDHRLKLASGSREIQDRA